jgi:hypothetical protein
VEVFIGRAGGSLFSGGEVADQHGDRHAGVHLGRRHLPALVALDRHLAAVEYFVALPHDGVERHLHGERLLHLVAHLRQAAIEADAAGLRGTFVRRRHCR